MATIYRVRALWTGMPGAPGVSTFYTGAAPLAGDLTAIRTFFNALAAGLPNTLTITVQGVGDQVDDSNGALVGTWTQTAPSTVAGTSASGYAAPVGSLVHWLTGAVVDGRRLRGTTYIVPTVNNYDANGTLLGAWVTTLTAAAQAMFVSLGTNLVIWHRPKFGPKPVGGGPRPVIRTGSSSGATGVFIPDKSVVLRSRRD